MKRQGDLFDNNIFSNFQTPKHSKVLQDFYIKLQDSGKAKLLALVRTSLRDPKLDCVRLLAELSNEQNFDVFCVPGSVKGILTSRARRLRRHPKAQFKTNNLKETTQKSDACIILSAGC